MRLDILATEPHHAAHVLDIWRALPDAYRGSLRAPYDKMAILPEAGPDVERAEAVLVAGYGDLKRARKAGYPHIALAQHGAGQSYRGGRGGHPSYPGGDDNDGVELFLCPNEYSAARWRERYPGAEVAVVGSPRVEHLHPGPGPGSDGPVIAVSFHWLCNIAPETRPAYTEYRRAVKALSKKRKVIGHGHPRAWRWLKPFYAATGIEAVYDFGEVCRRADLYVCDNSSTIFEFAATRRPVVLLNGRHYRRNVDHGGRFWEWATVGVQVDAPEDFEQAVSLALLDPPGIRQERERIVKQVYALVEGSTDAAVQALVGWLER